MWEIIVMIGWAIVAAFLSAVFLVISGFFLILIYTLYKVYFPGKKMNKKRCKHESVRYSSNDPYTLWTCNDCGKILSK